MIYTTQNTIANEKGIFFDEKKQTYGVDYCKTIQGKRVHIHGSNFLTKEEAMDEKRRLLRRKAKEMEIIAGKQISFESFFNRYLEYRSHHVRYSSLSQATTVYHKYFVSMKDRPIYDVINESEISAIYNEVIFDGNLCPSWKNRIIGIIRGFVSSAFKWKMISSETHQDLMSILENIPEGRCKVERPIWTKQEEQRFLSVIENPIHKIMFNLFLELGTRISEFLGITWDAYDGKKGCIHICRQLLHASQKRYVLSDVLKTKESYRTCKLKKEMKESINQYRKACESSPY